MRAALDGERVVRSLYTRPDPQHTRTHTLAWTVDDMLFQGWSMWRVLERDPFPARAERVAPERITVDYSNGVLRIDGRPVANADLIRFDGPDEGVLRHGGRALRTALMLEDAVRKFSRLDIPLGLIEDSDGHMLDTEIQEFLDSWETHRATRTTGYLPQGLKYTSPSFNSEQLELGDARAFQAAELARLLNLPASYINAPSNDSLTYSTVETNRRDLVDMTLAPFVSAIEQRLSMPDVTEDGTVVSLDFSAFIRGSIADIIATGEKAVTSGLMTVDEVRAQWLHLPPKPAEPTPVTEESA